MTPEDKQAFLEHLDDITRASISQLNDTDLEAISIMGDIKTADMHVPFYTNLLCIINDCSRSSNNSHVALGALFNNIMFLISCNCEDDVNALIQLTSMMVQKANERDSGKKEVKPIIIHPGASS